MSTLVRLNQPISPVVLNEALAALMSTDGFCFRCNYVGDKPIFVVSVGQDMGTGTNLQDTLASFLVFSLNRTARSEQPESEPELDPREALQAELDDLSDEIEAVKEALQAELDDLSDEIEAVKDALDTCFHEFLEEDGSWAQVVSYQNRLADLQERERAAEEKLRHL